MTDANWRISSRRRRCASRMDLSGGGIALGGVAAKPWCREAEATLMGAALSREAFAHAVGIALADAERSDDNAFKIY